MKKMKRIYDITVIRQGGQWIKNIMLVGDSIARETPMPYWTTSKPKELLKELCAYYANDEAFRGDVIKIAVECGYNRYYRKTIDRTAEV